MREKYILGSLLDGVSAVFFCARRFREAISSATSKQMRVTRGLGVAGGGWAGSRAGLGCRRQPEILTINFTRF